MLRTDLVELINSGNAWAFIGSGISADAGCPTWKVLVEKTVSSLEPEVRNLIEGDPRYKQFFEKATYQKCFARIEYYATRQHLEAAVSNQLSSYGTPGKLTKLLADWPFAGYVTTNYDRLLEIGLELIGGKGWVPVGNTQDEIKKLSADPTRLVWHIHGCAGLPREKSRLVLSEKDYDELYLGESPAVSQLKSLLAQRRVVFLGFGFTDPEVTSALTI